MQIRRPPTTGTEPEERTITEDEGTGARLGELVESYGMVRIQHGIR